MSSAGKRYAEVGSSRFAAFATEWLNSLPPDGWSGTAGELSDLLFARAVDAGVSRFLCIPTGSGLSKVLATTPMPGWSLGFSRTKSARLISFTRVPTPTCSRTPKAAQ